MTVVCDMLQDTPLSRETSKRCTSSSVALCSDPAHKFADSASCASISFCRGIAVCSVQCNQHTSCILLMEVIPPAQAVSDDVLVFVFKQLSAGWGPHTAQKIASTRFVWFRNTLPLVCKRWKRLVLGTPALWSSLVVDPTAEAHHVKRSGRHENAGSYDEQPKGGSGSCTPVRGASPLFGTSPDSDSGGYWTSQYAPYQGERFW